MENIRKFFKEKKIDFKKIQNKENLIKMKENGFTCSNLGCVKCPLKYLHHNIGVGTCLSIACYNDYDNFLITDDFAYKENKKKVITFLIEEIFCPTYQEEMEI